MINLGLPLVLFTDVAVCGAGLHEADIVTDGRKAYAYVEKDGEFTAIVREGTMLQGSCPAFREEVCGAQVEWDLSTKAWQQATNGTLLEFFAYAQPIEIGGER